MTRLYTWTPTEEEVARARPLRRSIQRLVEDPLSEQMLAGQWDAGDIIEVYAEDGALAFRKGEGVVAVPVAAPADEKAPRSTVPPRTSPTRGDGAAGGAASE